MGGGEGEEELVWTGEGRGEGRVGGEERGGGERRRRERGGKEREGQENGRGGGGREEGDPGFLGSMRVSTKHTMLIPIDCFCLQIKSCGSFPLYSVATLPTNRCGYLHECYHGPPLHSSHSSYKEILLSVDRQKTYVVLNQNYF